MRRWAASPKRSWRTSPSSPKPGSGTCDADLTGDVVPAVLIGNRRRARVRRYRTAGAAFAVLATVGAAVLATAGSTVRREPDTTSPGSRQELTSPASQPTDYCGHQNWLATPPKIPGFLTAVPSEDPSAAQADCEALQSALRTLFPDARIGPAAGVDLELDPHVDHAKLAKAVAGLPPRGSAWQQAILEYFGAELRYVHDHLANPANIFLPGEYSVVMPGGREDVVDMNLVPQGRDTRVDKKIAPGWAGSSDCAYPLTKPPHPCTMVGTSGGWHGALWGAAGNSETAADLIVDLESSGGKIISVLIATSSDGAREPKTDGTGQPLSASGPVVNRWTGQTANSTNRPAAAALTQAQWIRFLDSPALQQYADSYLSYAESLSVSLSPTRFGNLPPFFEAPQY